MQLKKILFLLVLLAGFSCADAQSGAWTRRRGLSAQGPEARFGAVAFSLDGYGYTGLGTTVSGVKNTEFWKYDPQSNTWSQVADFAGGARYGATAIVTDTNRAIVGFGSDNTTGVYFNDVYEYNAVSNTWTQQNSFPGAGRRQATGFRIGNAGYMVGGFNGSNLVLSELWKYEAGQWTRRSDLPAPGGRFNATAFSMGANGYVGLGSDFTGYHSEFYKYDTSADSWAAISPYPGNGIQGTVTLHVGDQDLVGLGADANTANSYPELYRYDTAADSWPVAGVFPTVPPFNATAFPAGGNGYFYGGTFVNGSASNDLWQLDNTGNWTKKLTLTDQSRESAAGFVIGETGYVFGGIDSNRNALAQLWAYDPAGDAWSQQADLPAAGRFGSAGFAYDGKGYICGGQGNFTFFSDTWQYDPAGNSWLQRAAFPGGGRIGSYAFQAGSKAYVGGGQTSSFPGSFEDLYEYDPAADSWSARSNFPGGLRADASSFAIDGIGYVTGGHKFNAPPFQDLYAYDPASDTWTQKADFPGAPRYSGASFSLYGKGYYGAGVDGPGRKRSDFYRYDPRNDAWSQVTGMPGGGVQSAVSYAIGDKGYVITGEDSAANLTDRVYEFTPDTATLVDSIPAYLCTNNYVLIPFTVNSAYDSGNVFTAELSDSTGSFDDPIELGSIASTRSDTIVGFVPATVRTASGYRIRITSTSPGGAGPDNGYDLTILRTARPFIYRSHDTLTTGSYSAYQWYKDGDPIPGATEQQYVYTEVGSYSVEVTNVAGCQTRSTLYVVTVDVLDLSKSALRIYPNPVTETVHVDAPSPLTLTVSDVHGRVLVRAVQSRSADVSALAPGVYLLTLSDAEGTKLKTEKLVKIK